MAADVVLGGGISGCVSVDRREQHQQHLHPARWRTTATSSTRTTCSSVRTATATSFHRRRAPERQPRRRGQADRLGRQHDLQRPAVLGSPLGLKEPSDVQSFYTNGSLIGFDPTNQSATARYAVGTHMLGNNDTEWVYVQAQTTISSLSWCVFNATFSAAMASAADVLLLSNTIALANGQISASSTGALAIRGANLSALFTGTGSPAPTSGQLQLASSGRV